MFEITDHGGKILSLHTYTYMYVYYIYTVYTYYNHLQSVTHSSYTDPSFMFGPEDGQEEDQGYLDKLFIHILWHRLKDEAH